MNDKEKQILEITQDLSDCLEYDIEDSSIVDTYDTAYNLVNKGWTKLPEDSVVFTKEEYTDYLILQKNYEFILETAKELQEENEKLKLKIDCLRETITWYDNDIKKIRKKASIELSERVKTKIKELKQRYHEDCVNGLGDEEYNGLTENNVDELLKEMGVE